LLLTTILANPINLGLTKMAEACLGTSLAKFSWLVAWLTLCQCRPDRPGEVPIKSWCFMAVRDG
jgi:Transposase.